MKHREIWNEQNTKFIRVSGLSESDFEQPTDWVRVMTIFGIATCLFIMVIFL